MGANVTSLSVYQNSLNTTTKREGETRTTLYFDGALFSKKKTYLSSVSTFFDQSVFIPQRKKNSIFNNSCPQTISLLRMFVCVCVCFDIVLLDFIQNTTRKNKKKKLISCHARVRLLVPIFPVFKAHTPTTIMYCAAVRSLFPD